ncbi:MAG: hypothetical protein GX557_14520 [Chloroflexi bacterium]|nr:hypothetical protein [Chloroflexota bacterium]
MTAAPVESDAVREPKRLGGGWQFALTCVLLASSLYVYASWIIDTRPLMNLNSYEHARFVDMVYGRAHRPFVYRALLPTIVREVRGAIPDPLNYDTHGKVYARFPALYGGMLYLGWELEYLTEYATAVVLMYAALLGFLFALMRLTRALYRAPEGVEFCVGIAAVWILPVFFVKGTHYIYDLPQLLIFTVLLLSLARHRWGLFYAVFLVGLYNKETTVLATLIFAVYLWDRMPRARMLGHLVAQGAMFAVTKLLLWWLFRSNPGSVVENHLWINVYNGLLRPHDLNSVVTVAALAGLVAYGYARKPALLRRALVIAAPMGLLYAVFGTYGEIRVFYELLPIVLLLSLPTLGRIVGVDICTRELGSGSAAPREVGA